MEYLRKGAQAASKLGNKILEVTTIAMLITSSRTGEDATACWARACEERELRIALLPSI
jgi:hypothetical protein